LSIYFNAARQPASGTIADVDEKRGGRVWANPFNLLVRPAGFESSNGGFRLTPQPAVWFESCRKHKKSREWLYLTITCISFWYARQDSNPPEAYGFEVQEKQI
jgi:hypothetical protein